MCARRQAQPRRRTREPGARGAGDRQGGTALAWCAAMIATDLMTENPRTIHHADPIRDALDALESMQIRHLPVVDDEGNLVGMLSDRDLGPLLRTSVEGAEAERLIVPLSTRKVSDFMSADVVSVSVDAEVTAIIETMLEERIGAVPVVDGEGGVVGIISYVDLLRAFAASEAEERGPLIGRDARPTRPHGVR